MTCAYCKEWIEHQYNTCAWLDLPYLLHQSFRSHKSKPEMANINGGRRLLLFDLDESIRYSKFDNRIEGVAPSAPTPKARSDERKLSMMIGVFLPCILAIFSGILFLRLGEFYLEADLFQSLSLLVIYTFCSLSESPSTTLFIPLPSGICSATYPHPLLLVKIVLVLILFID